MGSGTRHLKVPLRRLQHAAIVLTIGGVLALSPYPTCLLRVFFHLPCPACGLTRAGLALLGGRFATATLLHPLVIPLLLLFGLAVVFAATLDEPRWRAFLRASTAAAALALVIVWAARFAGLFGGPAPI